MAFKYARSEPPDSLDPPPAHHTADTTAISPRQFGPDLNFGNAVLFHGRLCLPYRVSPVPESFWDGGEWLEGPAGTAVGDHGHVFSHCSVAYHRPAGQSKITGLFRIDDALPPDVDRLRILFPPLAHTAGFEEVLCAIEMCIRSTVPSITGFRCR